MAIFALGMWEGKERLFRIPAGYLFHDMHHQGLIVIIVLEGSDS